MNGEAWLEASLAADGEVVEAVSEVLARFVSGGVVIESTQIKNEIGGEGRVTGLLRVSGYMQVDDQLEETKQKLREALWHLGQILPVPEIQFKPVADLNWSVVWKEHFQPVQIGEKLVIVPVWMDDSKDNRIAIKIDPGMAFGTGTHPTTQLCLEIICDLLDPIKTGKNQSASLIDVGCGSGILGIAALKLGAYKGLGVDLDPMAVDSARKSAQINGVADKLELEVGSLEEIKAGKFSISRAEIIVANILAPVILRLLDDGLRELITPGGKLILSGILEDQVLEIESKIEAAKLKLVEKHQMGDWIALVAE